MLGVFSSAVRGRRDTLSELREIERRAHATSFGHAPAPEPGVIELRNVSRAVGQGSKRRAVLRDLNARFEKGSFVAILGAKGSGKTSLINLLNANERPDGGRVLHGMNVSWPISSREILNKTLSVRSNVRFISEMYGAWPPGVLDAVTEMGRLKRSDIDKPLREVVDEVHNRAVVSLCLALKFDCFVADELLCRGSRQFREYMLGHFETLRGKHSLIIATRNVQIVRDLCDECYVLEGGTLRKYDRKGDAIRAFRTVPTPVVDVDESSEDLIEG